VLGVGAATDGASVVVGAAVLATVVVSGAAVAGTVVAGTAESVVGTDVDSGAAVVGAELLTFTTKVSATADSPAASSSEPHDVVASATIATPTVIALPGPRRRGRGSRVRIARRL
jgi:hypothetical protein